MFFFVKEQQEQLRNQMAEQGANATSSTEALLSNILAEQFLAVFLK